MSGEHAAQALYSLATALYHLEAAASDSGPLDAVALGEAVDAAARARLTAEARLRIVAAEHPDHHDDLARLAAAIRGGAISPDAAARSAGWIAALDA